MYGDGRPALRLDFSARSGYVAAMTRHVDFEKIENFRDFGDYPTRHGRRMPKGRFYRSANHHSASAEDLAVLSRLSPSHIVDLREKVERDREPSARWPGFSARVIETDLGHEPNDTYWEKMKTAPLTPEWMFEDGLDYYRRAPLVPRHIHLYELYFEALAEAEGPILVHCAAGKDRTGIICALTHHIAGVEDEHIFEDYLLTNDEGRIGRRIVYLQDLFLRNTGRALSAEAARVACSVHEEYLRTAFAVMNEACGSVDGYLEDKLGVDAARREALEARLLD